MRQNKGKTEKVSDYIAEKLNLAPKSVSLYIESHFADYIGQSRELKESLADSVQFYHPERGIILFGPDNITIKDKIKEGSGYESEAFQEFLLNRKSKAL